MEVVIFVGLPGSGKTSYRKKYPDYVIISQDDLGSLDKCITLFKKCLKENKSVVIDRCNISKKQRKLWLHLINEYGTVSKIDGISLVLFNCKKDTCYKRILERSNHPTITKKYSKERIKKILNRFEKDFEKPDFEEGYSSITSVFTEEKGEPSVTKKTW